MTYLAVWLSLVVTIGKGWEGLICTIAESKYKHTLPYATLLFAKVAYVQMYKISRSSLILNMTCVYATGPENESEGWLMA